MARSTNPFSVTETKTGDFVSLAELKKAIVNRKKNTHKQKVEWLKMRWIHVSREELLIIKYRYSHNTLEAWKAIDVKRKTRGRPVDMGKVALPPLYDGPRAIKDAKLRDLLQLLVYVPPIHHSFYHKLRGTSSPTDSEEESEGTDTEAQD